MIIPNIIEKASAGAMVSYDIFSRLLQERILFVGGLDGEVSAPSATILISQLLYLDHLDDDKPISLYINSPGGSVSAGLAIYDTMQFLKSPITTICMGQAASFGAVLLAAGTKGQRFVLPHSRIMIHQPLIYGGGISGQATDIELENNEMQRLKKELTQILANHTGNSYEKVRQDCERNFYMSAEEAKAYGLVDQVITTLPNKKV